MIFHLAAIVSGEAEMDFAKGYAVNLDGTRRLFGCRDREGQRVLPPGRPFASSVAVFGAPLPDLIDDDFLQAPLTSYGTQKLIGELLLADYTRKGLMDGIGIRLPTICVRPGAPEQGGIGLFSPISYAQPLAGQEAVLPVEESVTHWHASPRSAIGFLIRAASLDGQVVGPRRTLNMPGVRVSVGEQIEALRRIAGDRVVARIRREPDPQIAAIVPRTGRRGFNPQRCAGAGLHGRSRFRRDHPKRISMTNSAENSCAERGGAEEVVWPRQTQKR